MVSLVSDKAMQENYISQAIINASLVLIENQSILGKQLVHFLFYQLNEVAF